MNNKIKYLFIFAAGAALGVASSCLYFDKKYKQKYEDIANSEINSAIKNLKAKEDIKAEEKNDTQNSDTHEKTDTYEEIIETNKYRGTIYDDEDDDDEYIIEEVEEEEVRRRNVASKPYVISPGEFGDHPDYDIITLKFYADKVLTDEVDEIMDDPDSCVGWTSLTHFGEYEDDTVYVRNDRLKADYEILREPETYEEMLEEKPYLRR